MKIIRYRIKADIDVQFLDDYGYIKRNVTYQNFISGQIKNPYDKTVYNVGFLGDGKHPTKINNVRLYKYACWHDMLLRCYGKEQKHNHKSYYGLVEVCKEWHNYQKFAEWYDNNFYDLGEGRMHLDKDILYPGNNLYSPKTCIFVPQRINELFHYKPKTDNLPCGVRLVQGRKYSASYRGKHLGVHKTIEKAFEAYANRKEEVIKEIADKYKGKIPEQLYQALIDFKVLLKNDKVYNPLKL